VDDVSVATDHGCGGQDASHAPEECQPSHLNGLFVRSEAQSGSEGRAGSWGAVNAIQMSCGVEKE